MKRWSRRLLFIIFIVLWLILLCFPFTALVLAMSDEITIGAESRSHIRLFLVNSSDHTGLGLEVSRPVRGEEGCYRTDVRYMLWEGREEGLNVSFEECVE